MGRVYRVEDTKLKREIALKLIKPEIAKDKKTIERFRNELKLARDILRISSTLVILITCLFLFDFFAGRLKLSKL